jgi:streptogramin lyase
MVLPLSGCQGVFVTVNNADANAAPAPAMHGVVHGGQSPITGSHVYLYAAGTGGYGLSSTSLLTTGTQDGSGHFYVTTDSNGNFNIDAGYTCPGSTGEVYLYAVGGEVGAQANPLAGLMAGLGSCTSLSASTYVVMNEVSTVATAYALAGYAVDATHISSPASVLAQQGIANAFASIRNLESLGTGAALAVTPASNGAPPQSEIDTLADILSACINTNGSMTPGTACNTLLGRALSGGTSGAEPSDTATAAINIAHNPWANTAALYGLQPGAGAPFQPTLGAAPNDFTMAISFTGGGLSCPQGLAIDASGNVWIADSCATAIIELSTSGAVKSGSGGFTGGGLSGPVGLALDSSGNAWIADSSSILAEFNSGGVAQSGQNGFSGGGLANPDAVAIDGLGNIWLSDAGSGTGNTGSGLSEFSSSGSAVSSTAYTGSGLDDPQGVAIAVSGNVWAVNLSNSALSEFNSAGVAQSGAGGFTNGGLDGPQGIAIDALGNVWAANSSDNTLSEFSSSGTEKSGSGFTGGGLNSPLGIAIDGAGNTWVSNNAGNSISEFNSSGTPISGGSGFVGGSLNGPVGIVIDGSGNLWVSNIVGGSISEFVGAASPVVTPVVANLLSPYGSAAVNKP